METKDTEDADQKGGEDRASSDTARNSQKAGNHIFQYCIKTTEGWDVRTTPPCKSSAMVLSPKIEPQKNIKGKSHTKLLSEIKN